MKNDKGYLLYANFSRKIDYGKLAVCCALSIKTNLVHNNVTVVVDKQVKKSLEKQYTKEILAKIFDTIIVSENEFQSSLRTHYDNPWNTFKTPFNNKHRILAYNHSPYKETILMDVDYLVMNDDLDNVWGCNDDLLMNKKAVDLQGNIFGDISDQKLSQDGIPMYWATLVYFKKCPYSEAFFDLINYIKDEYDYFRFLYEFECDFYRNDFSFSIASHIMNGYSVNQRSFPIDTIITSYQEDTIVELIDSKEIIFMSWNLKERWKHILVNTKGMNIHVMNKLELIRISNDFIKSSLEKL
jgi:hypothetical protein